MSVPRGTPALSSKDRDGLADFFRHGGTFCASLLPSSALAEFGFAALRDFQRSFLWVTDGPKSLDALFQDFTTLAGTREPPLVYSRRGNWRAREMPSRPTSSATG